MKKKNKTSYDKNKNYKVLDSYLRTCHPSNSFDIHWSSDQWHCHKEHYLYNVHMACCNLFHRNLHCILDIFSISNLFTYDINYEKEQRPKSLI